MIIAAVAAKAQTFNCQGIIPILMGDSVIFDLPEHPFDVTLHLNKKNGYGIYCFEYESSRNHSGPLQLDTFSR